MKEIFQLFAEYNSSTNKTMLEILEKLSPEQLTQDLGSYYHSIMGVLSHILVSDTNQVKRISGFFENVNYIADTLPVFENPMETAWDDLEEYKIVRTQVDEAIVELIESLTEEEISTRVTYTTYRGDEMEKVVYHMLMHMFNHETHHRGTVSVLLDQMSVENDYSGMIGLNH